jgi:hypothetical protein
MADSGCPVCGGTPYKRHCKQVCSECGRVIADCSDPFRF